MNLHNEYLASMENEAKREEETARANPPTTFKIKSKIGEWEFNAFVATYLPHNLHIHVVSAPESERNQDGVERFEKCGQKPGSFPLGPAIKMIHRAYESKRGHGHFRLELGEVRGWWEPQYCGAGGEWL